GIVTHCISLPSFSQTLDSFIPLPSPTTHTHPPSISPSPSIPLPSTPTHTLPPSTSS
ncbi:unnamed protein product, partial [Closterium sp. NIES-54]